MTIVTRINVDLTKLSARELFGTLHNVAWADRNAWSSSLGNGLNLDSHCSNLNSLPKLKDVLSEIVGRSQRAKDSDPKVEAKACADFLAAVRKVEIPGRKAEDDITPTDLINNVDRIFRADSVNNAMTDASAPASGPAG